MGFGQVLGGWRYGGPGVVLGEWFWAVSFWVVQIGFGRVWDWFRVGLGAVWG